MCRNLINWKAFRRESRWEAAKLFVVIFVIATIVYGIYHLIMLSFDECDGAFGDTFTLKLKDHKNYHKFKQGMCSDSHIGNEREYESSTYNSIARIIFKNATMEEVRCGGGLISNDLVVTAAHCIDSDEKNLQVHLGGSPEKGYNDSIRIVNIKIIIHPSYNKSKFQNDIALIKFEKPVKFDKNLNTLCIPFDDHNVPKNLTLSLWHHMSVDSPVFTETFVDGVDKLNCSLQLADGLKRAIGKSLKNEIDDKVEKDFRKHYKPIKFEQFCAGSETLVNGNSGMPIHSKDVKTGAPIIFGIVSFGSKDMSLKYPTVFTQIYSYRHWILCNA